MYDMIFRSVEKLGTGSYTELIAYILSFAAIIIISLFVKLIAKIILITVMTRISKSTKYTWDDILLKNRFFHKLTWLAIPIIFNIFDGSLPAYNNLIIKISGVVSILLFITISITLLNSVGEIYRGYEVSKVRPIKGLLQVSKVTIFIIGTIILISHLIGQNPIVLLGGIGAMTAIISLIFKDSILGFIAGIQLTANDMIRIGDWIEMPKYSADGTIIDLSLTTVKVQNFDNTVTSVPAYALVSDSFINWRGMEKSGGRRIKRSVYIDASGIRLCDDVMINRFRKINLIAPYIESRLSDITEYNSKHKIDTSTIVNGRHLTNLGVFRIYITEYLKQHPGIRNDMSLMVRQLSSAGAGIPLELYAFTNTIKWSEYETIQADIFDHIYSVISEFGLTIYQQPTGRDIRSSLQN